MLNDDRPFAFGDPSRWNTDELRTIWLHWQDRQKKKTTPFAFLESALDSINNIRESTVQSDHSSTFEGEDVDTDSDGNGGNSKMRGNLHKVASNSQQDHASPLTKKQQMIGVKNGRVVIDKESGFAVESQTDSRLNHSHSEDDDLDTTFDGPPEPGQQTIKVSNGQVVIYKGFESHTDDNTSDEQNSTVDPSSPCASLLPPIEFLSSLSMEKEWLNAVRAATDIPVRFIFILVQISC